MAINAGSTDLQESLLDPELASDHPLKTAAGGDDDDHDAVEPSAIGQGSAFASFAALANTLLGAGILGLPGAFAATGYALGCALLVLFASTSAFGLHLLYCCASRIGLPSSFRGVSEASVPSLAWVVDACIAIKCFGVATSYLIVVGDGMPDVAKETSFLPSQRFVWVFVGWCIVAPLAFMRTLRSLRFTATASLGFVIFIVFLVVAYAVPSLDPCGDGAGALGDDENCGGHTLASVNKGMFAKLTVFVFAFTCHQNAFSTLHNELRDPTPARANGVIACSVGLALACYLTISIAGYTIFGSEVPSDVLAGFDSEAQFSVARAFISTLVCFCYPLQAHPARASIISLLKRGGPRACALATSPTAHAAVTVVFLVASFGIAMVVHDLGIVLSVVGATGSTTITFILPGICYYKVH